MQNLWFLPLVVMALVCGLFGATIWLDTMHVLTTIKPFSFFYQLDIDASRALIGKLAAAIMTMAGIVFSLVFVALSLASGQFGPRLLQHFISDKMTQTALGLFIATFVFQSLTFLSLGENLPFDTVPGITLSLALLMVLMCLLFLVFYIHHLAKSLQADVVVDGIFQRLKNKLLKIKVPKIKQQEAIEATFSEATQGRVKIALKLKESGYMQAIDKNKLSHYCAQNQLFVCCLCNPGDYIVAGEPVAHVYGEENADGQNEELARYFKLGATRTALQDLEFEIHQLTEIAIRSLSTGINDPFTAHTCIDKLSEVAIIVTSHGLPSPFTLDKHQEPRLRLPALELPTVFEHLFSAVIRHGKTDFSVANCFVAAFLRIAPHCKAELARKALQQQVTLFLAQQQGNVTDAEHAHFVARLAAIQ
ncbi:DUF2254 domain-containing protein [Planctobacterium marinum]|uniref:DUF2254 domain-containing protein n=1 Tax=Planctobacterium marinum TaxID=1631968 RepID=A0AA48HHK2_9ALTE|nr:hypothetical protein MACH26_03170 [Planctobacterium marinum]